MRYSKHNIFSKIKDSEDYFIVNPLSGNADILSPADAWKIILLKSGENPGDDALISELTEKGYIADEASEEKLFRTRYLNYLDSRETDEIQIFFVANYSCNFACSYCYQDQYGNPLQKLTTEVTDAFFSYIEKEFQNRRKYVTVFGGEPLLNSPEQKETIRHIVAVAAAKGIELSYVTNGYFLEEYLDILSGSVIREIQVTLDGTGKVHDSRRFLKGGAGTFEKIVRGIDESLRRGININLRMVADKENLSDLPHLAAFAIERGWTGSPFFKTQIGRNYELHHCQSAPDKLYDRISLYSAIYELIKNNPEITRFYKPSYSISKFISENGELPDPLFDSCPACKTEWAFDYSGKIFSCTATVGKSDEALGTFFPSVSRRDDLISEWEKRDITSIAGCRDCSMQLACGGGCGSVAKNNTGKICSPDCRPVDKLLELGFSAYLQDQN